VKALLPSVARGLGDGPSAAGSSRDLYEADPAATEPAAAARFDEFAQAWGGQYPAR
jgi:hypothetical protein